MKTGLQSVKKGICRLVARLASLYEIGAWRRQVKINLVKVSPYCLNHLKRPKILKILTKFILIGESLTKFFVSFLYLFYS